MTGVAAEKPDKEGRLNHRNLSFREVFKERWFKLKGNLLFYFRLNEYGGVYETEPVGVFVMECCKIQHEPSAEHAFAFSIAFSDDAERKHLFTCTTQKHCDEWVSCLQQASYEYQRGRLIYMQQKILELTGRDPLADFISRRNGNAPGSVQAIQKLPDSSNHRVSGVTAPSSTFFVEGALAKQSNVASSGIKKRTTVWH